MENSEIAEPTSKNTAPSMENPGEILSEARKKLGISQAKMAELLNLSRSKLVAVEENRFEELAAPVFARGYLRAYARQVQVDVERVEAAYDNLPSVKQEETADHQLFRTATTHHLNKTGMAVPIGIAILVVLLIVTWWAQDDAPAPAAPDAVQLQEPAAVTPPVGQVTPTATGDTPPPAIGGEPTELAESNQPETLPPPQMTEAEPMATVDLSTPAPSPTPEVATAAGQGELFADQSAPEPAEPRDVIVGSEVEAELLEFQFSGECWLEVYNGLGELMYNDLHQDGDQVTLRGVGPFDVLLGDSRHVDLNYQGEPVEIQPRPNDVIARVRVGVEQ